MTKIHLVARASCDSPDSDSHQPSTALERAVAKIILLGATVGVSADLMIGLLDAGMTVEELLEYVLSLPRNLPDADSKSCARSVAPGTGRARDARGDCNV